MKMWRAAQPEEDAQIIELSLALYAEDPAPDPVPPEHTRATLAILRTEPARGMAVVLDLDGTIAGYGFLISFWSNELGGEVVVIDELYIKPAHRSQGHGRELVRLLSHQNTFSTRKPVALELEVTPENRRAAALYAQLGFTAVKNARLRLVCNL